MPLTVMDNVPFSEMRGTAFHQGPRNAGNKSLLTYRSDIGIPGYKGYTPGWCTVPIPITGSTVHTGKIPDDGHIQEQVAQADQHHAASEYSSAYKANAANYHRPTLTGGGFWFEERQRKAANDSPLFLGTTTYKSEVIGKATVQQQLQHSLGVDATLDSYKVARERRTQSADPRTHKSHSLSSTTALTRKGELVGYLTTYRAAAALIAEKAAAIKEAATAQRRMSCSGTERLHMAMMPNAGKPLFDGTSTYARDFGTQGTDPKMRAAAKPAEQTLTATTKSLNEGTTRACHQLPGYTGFIPAAAMNDRATQQASGTTSRPNIKTGMLPATLDQYSRSRLSHYTGYKPRAGPGATTVQPAHGPTAETTQGFVNMQVLRVDPQPADSRYAIDSRRGLMTFFTGGGESISDNGEADAQKFFLRLRPLEGRVKTGIASATNEAGAKFTR